MPRHELRPGRLVAGVTVLGAAVAYAGDAAGAWPIPWFAVFPVLFCGFFVAAVVALVDYRMRQPAVGEDGVQREGGRAA